MTENRPQDYLLYQSASTLGPLNTKLIKISSNNVIAILTASGICLMRGDNDWNESFDHRHYRKSIIANPKHTFGQYLQRILKRNVNRLSSDEMQKLYLDHTLFPLNNAAAYKNYRNFEWSQGGCLNNEPLFALLSMEHELWIYQPSQTDAYEPIINVSKLLLDGYARTHKQKHELTFESVKDLIYSTAIIKMRWTEFVPNDLTNPAGQTSEPSAEPSGEGASTARPRKRSRSSSSKRSLTETEETTEFNRSSVRNFSCLLIALSRNGTLYFFRIDQSETALNCTYLNEWKPENRTIKDVFYFNSLLVLVFASGQVELISFELNLQDLNEQNFDFSQLIKQEISLWTEEDHIEVDDLLVYEHRSAINVVFTKTEHIIVKVLEVISNQTETRKKRTCSVSNQLNRSTSPKKSSSHRSREKVPPNMPTVASNRQINHSHEQLQVQKSLVEESLFKISSSGLCRLHQNDLLIASADGNYYRVEITDDCQLKQSKFTFPGLTSESYCPASLAATSEGYLCCTISYICSYFDHLELRDSTRITVFTTLSRAETFAVIANLIETNEPINFGDLYNLLECFKIYRLTNEKSSFDFSGHCQADKLDQLSDLNLKVLRFALLCDQACKQRIQSQLDPNIAKFTFEEEAKKVDRANSGDTSVDQGVVEIDSRDMVLVEDGDCKMADNLANGSSQTSSSNGREFSQTKSKQKEANSLHHGELIRKIEDILSGRHFSELFKAKLEMPEQTGKLSGVQQESVDLISSYSSAIDEAAGRRKPKKKKARESTAGERCPICEQPVEPTDRYLASCSNGHEFARCCYSLLICDLARYDYKLCALCKRLTFIFPMIWPSNENSSYCLYCC